VYPRAAERPGSHHTVVSRARIVGRDQQDQPPDPALARSDLPQPARARDELRARILSARRQEIDAVLFEAILAQALHPEELGDRAGGSRSAAGRSRHLAAPSGRAATRAAQPPPRLAIRDDGAGRGRMAGPEEEAKEVEAMVVDTRTHFAHSRVSGNPGLDVEALNICPGSPLSRGRAVEGGGQA